MERFDCFGASRQTYFTFLLDIFFTLHLCLFLFLVKLALVLGGGVLVLLVLGDQIVHVALGFGELHLVHALAGVPVQESLSSEHGGELLADSLEELLDSGAVTNEGSAHLESTWWDVADGGLNVVGDPFNKVAAVLVLDVQHLLVDLLHGHASSEHGGDSQVSSVSWVAGGHHVLGIEHLLGELGHGQGAVLLATSAGEGSEAWHEEVQTWEWNHVDGQFAEIGVQLTWESEAGGDTAHGGADEMVQVAVGGRGEFERSEANVVESFVVNAVGLVGVLYELMHGESGVVGLDDGVAYLGRGYDGKGVHDSVGVFLSDLGDEKSSHAGSGSTAQRVSKLKSLQTIATLGLLSHNVQDRVDKLGALGVVSLGPVVTGSALSKYKVVGSEDLAKGARSDRVHGTWLQVDKDGSRNVLAAGSLIVVDIDALKLEIAVAVVGTSWVDSVLVGDDLPELGTDLVTALAGLKMDNLSHVGFFTSESLGS